MTKSEFVRQVAQRSGLSKKDAQAVVDAFLKTIESALERGDEVTFTGFGKFHVAERTARQGRHPRTGEQIHIPSSRVPRFSAGSALKKAVTEEAWGDEWDAQAAEADSSLPGDPDTEY